MKHLLPLASFVLMGLMPVGSDLLAGPDDGPSPEEIGAATYTVKMELDLEKVRLEKDLASYASNEARRQELRDQISVLYVRISGLVRQSGFSEEDADSLEALQAELLSAEQAEEAVRTALRNLRDRISLSREKMRFLGVKLAELRRSVPAEVESMTGTWEVTYLPSGDRGLFTLRQSGTLISGEYQQEGGWKGSLQGTFVNNKLVLHRIDSKLGPATDLEGVVSNDLKSIKGTWQSLVLSDGGPASGAWTGKKRETRKKAEGG
jgi:hypothetical protein